MTLPQHVKQPTLHVALDFLRSIYTTDSTTAAAKWSKSGFPIFLTFTGLLNTTQDPHKWFCLTAQAMRKWNWLLATETDTLSSGWKPLFLPCVPAGADCCCFARRPRQWSQRITVSTMTKSPTRRTGTTITSVWCSRTTISKQRKKMENQGISSTLVLYNHAATIQFSNFQPQKCAFPPLLFGIATGYC